METQHYPEKRLRGFALMSLEARHEIARKGGRMAQSRGTAHQWTSQEARVAGQRSADRRLRERSTIFTKKEETYHADQS